MTITNGYATLAEVKREAAIESLDVVDDAVLEQCIEDASRLIDGHCGGRQFYAAAASYQYDAPRDGDRTLWLGQDWLSFSAITNGDGVAVAASLYQSWPANSQHKAALVLRPSANVSWQPASTGDYLAAITVAGSIGYVDRAASDAQSVRIVSNTHRACVLTALWLYRSRFAQQQAGAQAQPAYTADLPPSVAHLLEGYRWQP